MAEYIERDKVMDVLLHEQYGYLCEDAINAIPAADVRENKRGKWMYDDDVNTGLYAICSCCKESIYQAFEFYYCPNCGADMREFE